VEIHNSLNRCTVGSRNWTKKFAYLPYYGHRWRLFEIQICILYMKYILSYSRIVFSAVIYYNIQCLFQYYNLSLVCVIKIRTHGSMFGRIYIDYEHLFYFENTAILCCILCAKCILGSIRITLFKSIWYLYCSNVFTQHCPRLRHIRTN